jgi:hypothetical protein
VQRLPRKLNEMTRARSSAELILLMAWAPTDFMASSGGIPKPSSGPGQGRPCHPLFRPRSCSPASRAFSRSSLIAEAGRSITSPAAIRCATSGGRTRTRPRRGPPPRRSGAETASWYQPAKSLTPSASRRARISPARSVTLRGNPARRATWTP